MTHVSNRIRYRMLPVPHRLEAEEQSRTVSKEVLKNRKKWPTQSMAQHNTGIYSIQRLACEGTAESDSGGVTHDPEARIACDV